MATIESVFTVAQRDDLAKKVLRLAADDDRVVAAAIVGSLANGDGDHFSDVDLTFGVANRVPIIEVLDDWTRALTEHFGGVCLADLERGPTTYRVFLLPDALQLDLSMAPAAQFRPSGPRFRVLFGETAAGDGETSGSRTPAGIFIPTPCTEQDLFGWGVIYALHARACIGRRRFWQAEHYIGAVRDHALALACLRLGHPAAQARGYDELPTELLAGLQAAHVGAVDPLTLRSALAASVLGLLREATDAHLPDADTVGERLAELLDGTAPRS